MTFRRRRRGCRGNVVGDAVVGNRSMLVLLLLLLLMMLLLLQVMRVDDRRGESSLRRQSSIRLLNRLSDIHRVVAQKTQGPLQQLLLLSGLASAQERQKLLKLGNAEAEEGEQGIKFMQKPKVKLTLDD